MKKLIFTVVFGLIGFVGLNAQDEVTVPENITSITVVVAAYAELGNCYFSIEDGTTSTLSKIPIKKGTPLLFFYSGLVAQTCNKLAKQGYKLISSNGAAEIANLGSVYIFQKE